jgi:hypothetical protein
MFVDVFVMKEKINIKHHKKNQNKNVGFSYDIFIKKLFAWVHHENKTFIPQFAA